jgi:hypothetical protein
LPDIYPTKSDAASADDATRHQAAATAAAFIPQADPLVATLPAAKKTAPALGDDVFDFSTTKPDTKATVKQTTNVKLFDDDEDIFADSVVKSKGKELGKRKNVAH